MAGGRRRAAVAAEEAAGGEKGSTGEAFARKPKIISDEPCSESEVAKLRRCWELASVFNFLSVFKPIIGKDLKVLAEEIEMGLIQPNSSLVQLHIILLKGIPPASKILDDPESVDAWVTVLCKKLEPWWPWVAEGEFPLNAANGLEISRYNKLSPTTRLLILKALCELRVEQDDAVGYINDSLKDGTGVSSFRKDEIGCHGNRTSYWLDTNAVTGFRLYKEVKTVSRTNLKGKLLTCSTTSFQWETLATHLKEFRKVAEELASSKVPALVAVGETIEADAISVLERSVKKKENALKRKQRQEMRLNSYKNLYGTRITRSCRSRRPISYTYDEYDQAINEAIRQTNGKGKTSEGSRHDAKHRERGEMNGNTSSEGSDMDMDPKDSSGTKGDSMNSDSENDRLQEVNNGDSANNDNDHVKDSNSDEGNDSIGKNHEAPKPGDCRSKRLDGRSSDHVVETRSPLAAKNRLRQRPTRNSALDSAVVPDSDDEKLGHVDLYAEDSEEC